jgi:hypothetical protein
VRQENRQAKAGDTNTSSNTSTHTLTATTHSLDPGLMCDCGLLSAAAGVGRHTTVGLQTKALQTQFAALYYTRIAAKRGSCQGCCQEGQLPSHAFLNVSGRDPTWDPWGTVSAPIWQRDTHSHEQTQTRCAANHSLYWLAPCVYTRNNAHCVKDNLLLAATQAKPACASHGCLTGDVCCRTCILHHHQSIKAPCQLCALRKGRCCNA